MGLKHVEHLMLEDAKLSNGTQRNGRSLPADPEQAVVPRCGHEVTFGEWTRVDCKCHDGATL